MELIRELFETDAWIALLEIGGVGGIICAIGMYGERKEK